MAKRNLHDAEWQGRAGHQKTVLFNEDELRITDAKVQVIRVEPGKKIEPHYHKIRTEAFYVLQGAGIIQQNEENLHCVAHDYFLSKPDTIHAVENTGDEDFIIMIFRTNDPGESDMHWVNEPTQV